MRASMLHTRHIRQHLYHQVLVSSRLGGAEKLAVEIHKNAIRKRVGVSKLIVPQKGDVHGLAASEGFDYLTYRLDFLQSKNQFYSVLANIEFYVKLFNSRGLLHIHSPSLYWCIATFFLYFWLQMYSSPTSGLRRRSTQMAL